MLYRRIWSIVGNNSILCCDTQVPDVDYSDTFSPIVKITSIRVLLALSAIYDWEIHQLDVKIAFLYGDLKEVIFMKQHKGYIIRGCEQ
jgi:hypothetical protein